jgi:ADP-heptose:LPS heptosyltransferase
MAGVLKREFPESQVSLLVRRTTSPVARYCRHVHAVLNWDEIERLPAREQVEILKRVGADVIIHIYPNRAIARRARQAGIRVRIGTIRRHFHWLSCNRLVRLRRKNSPLHEAQLNLKLLEPLGIKRTCSAAEICGLYGLDGMPTLDDDITALIDPLRFNLIVHPKSGGTAREWPCEYFVALIRSLPPARFNILVTGSEQEGEQLRGSLPWGLPHVVDLMGRLSLAELISLIAAADGLVAASTGPLHIAAALGKHALGIYSPLRSKRASRWGPIGTRARVFQLDRNCAACHGMRDCECVRRILPDQIKDCLRTLARSQGALAPTGPE